VKASESSSNEVRAALQSANRMSALQRLKEPSVSAELRVAMLPELLSLCAYHGQGFFLAQEVVALIDRPTLEREAWLLVERYLDGSDSEPFHNFANLFSDLQLTQLLRRLIERAREFDDADIREVADRFQA
jgi:hypothetical protein